MRNGNREEELETEIRVLRARVSELESIAANCPQVEKTLRDQLQFLQILIDTIPNPIFFKDRNGKYLGCNKAFERRVGLTRGDIIEKLASNLFPEELATRYEQHDSELFNLPGEKMYETRLTYADGQNHDVIITKGIFTDSEGNVSGLVGVTLDITERKRAEKALQKAHDELEMRVKRRTAALAEANSKLEKEVAERSRIAEELRISAEKLKIFAYSVAHDLKSPSIGIYGLARLLQKNFAAILGPKGADFCDNIMKASEHVASLVRFNQSIHLHKGDSSQDRGDRFGGDISHVAGRVFCKTDSEANRLARAQRDSVCARGQDCHPEAFQKSDRQRRQIWRRLSYDN